jgi:hypothetical protein
VRERTHITFISFCYLLGISFFLYALADFHAYYSLPLEERPHSPLHMAAKPGGSWGHGMGIAGGAMLLLLFLYSARKRGMFTLGTLPHWLNIHIMFGIVGPMLVTLHSAFKFSGIVSVSYYSMMAVMASGIFGRYLYLQIPRAITGGELSFGEIQERKRETDGLLADEFGLEEREVRELEGILGLERSRRTGFLRAMLSFPVDAVRRRIRIPALKRKVRVLEGSAGRGREERISDIVVDRALLARKQQFLETTQRVFYYWHVVHKPFAIVMILIMFIHIVVTVFMGYTWIF